MTLLPALASTALLTASAVVRAPSPAMLLGADGMPMKKAAGAAAAASAQSGGGAASGLLSSEGTAAPEIPSEFVTASGRSPFDDITKTLASTEIPVDLANFDPTFDPLAVERPTFDLAAASGRPDEAVWGAVAAESAAHLAEWSAHMKEAGISAKPIGERTVSMAATSSTVPPLAQASAGGAAGSSCGSAMGGGESKRRHGDGQSGAGGRSRGVVIREDDANARNLARDVARDAWISRLETRRASRVGAPAVRAPRAASRRR